MEQPQARELGEKRKRTHPCLPGKAGVGRGADGRRGGVDGRAGAGACASAAVHSAIGRHYPRVVERLGSSHLQVGVEVEVEEEVEESRGFSDLD
ncbi:hypothetical protein ACLOJK_037738 [Asimina triloba]